MVKIYKQPFAHSGDTIAIPDATQPDGKLSNSDGWTLDYQLPRTAPNYKPVGRQEMNGVFKEVTEALGQVQVQGSASWSLDGAPYPINAQVYRGGKQWLALRPNSVEPAEGEDWTAIGTAKQLATKVGTSTQVIAGTGLSGGGTLAANRTLAVSYGTTAGTAAQGDDSRITGALQTSQVVQVTGASTTSIMSQKAVTDAIAAGGWGSAAIKTPSIISPVAGAANTDLQLVIEGSPFEVLDGVETLDGAIFEYRDFNGEVVFISPKTAAEVVYETPRYVLNPLSTYSVRVLYIGVIYGASAWSAPVTFSTSDISIATPAIIEPEEGAVDVPEQPIFESSVFAMASGEAFFDGLQFRVRDENDDVVHLSPKITYYEYAPPAGVLQDGKSKYKVDTKHFGQGVNPSAWSNAVSFTTMESFLPSEPGEPFGGGFFVALYNHPTDGRSALIDAGAAGDFGALQLKTVNTATAGTDDLTDGQASTAAMIAAGRASHPAAAACVDYRGGGHDDWFLGAKNQSELKYRYLKPFTQANHTSSGTNTAAIPPTGNYTASVPAQTTVANYKKGATDAFAEDSYWTSTQYSTSGGWDQGFTNGLQYNYYKNLNRHVRASRSIKV